ncbi:MAG: glycoside hydrolase family 2 protein [Tannerella sp.]|nr:glycoside hydrolase family 2 protein [Tannerella sp.]
MNKILIYISVIVALTACRYEKNSRNETGKINWPEITQEAKPWTRWWWFGSAVDEAGITASLEAYQKAGLGGVEITPVYGVRSAEKQFIEFLSPEWVDLFIYTLNEAKRLGLGVDLANASGWPFGGPWIDETAACKYMASQTFTIRGGTNVKEIIRYIQEPLVRTQGRIKVTVEDIKEPVTANDNLQEYAFDQIRYKKELPLITISANKKGENGFDKVIDLTDRVVDGRLEWEAPEGEWVLCALFQGLHGKMVERAGPGGEGNVIDHFSTEALKKYLDKFDDTFRDRDVSYLRYYFNDSYEVDDAIGESNWTPEFLTEFEKIQGYDLRQYLPALLGLDTRETNSRVMYDYRVVIGRLLLEKYTKEWQKWAARQGKGIRNQSHGSPANVLDLYAASDIPEIEGRDIVNLKSAPSAAHVTGKKLTSSESATWLNEHFISTLGDVKSVINKFLLAGVNHVFYHGTAYSPQDAEWPGWLFYASVHFSPANSFWDDFGALNRSVARAQSFLQAGRPANDILLYYAVSDLWSKPTAGILQHYHSFNNVSLKECGEYLTENGYSWDAISDKQLLDVLYEKKALCAEGNIYKTIWIPETHYMPAATFEQLINLAQKGATIAFYKNLPADVPGLAGYEANSHKMDSLKKKLSFSENGNVSTAAYGKGKIILSDQMSGLAEASGVTPEDMYTSKLQCIRRLKEDGNFYYYIVNSSKEPFDGWITLNADYLSAALYNPLTAASGYAKTRRTGDKTEIYLQIKPEESFIIETFRGRHNGDLYPFYKHTGETVALSGNWDIEFIKGGPTLPAKITTGELKSWTKYGQAYIPFSGTAKYTTTIPALTAKADAWLLDLGTVHESASIYLNGEHIGTLLHAPYTLEIRPDKLNGNDELVINVSNLMANRIIDMDKNGVVWRKFYNTNFNARLRENTGEDGKFTALKWEPKDSGLSGPVILRSLAGSD